MSWSAMMEEMYPPTRLTVAKTVRDYRDDLLTEVWERSGSWSPESAIKMEEFIDVFLRSPLRGSVFA